MTHPQWRRLLVTIVCGMLLALPGSGLAQVATPGDRECVPNEVDGTCLALAPAGSRVDTAAPVFSDPAAIDNPLFPIAGIESALLVGTVDDLPFRTEITLLSETRTIAWNGQEVEVLVSQYTAYLDGRIMEVALDWYAQADDGSVWYFGEDVFNYEDGVVADTHGAWMAGRDGPAGMIMPGNPQEGDVYRPENIPGLVFEEVTVKETGVTVDGPTGPVDDAIIVTELHADGTTEDKTFAPGYGEFLTDSDGDVEALALAVPRDAQTTPAAAELETLVTGAMTIAGGAQAGAGDDVVETLAGMNAAWDAYQATGAPALLAVRMRDALAALDAAVETADTGEIRQAALQAGQAALDLQLRHLSPGTVDAARFDLWTHQVNADAAALDEPALAGDVATMEWIWDRIAPTAEATTAQAIEAQLTALRAAIEAGNLPEVTSVAADLHALARQLGPR